MKAFFEACLPTLSKVLALGISGLTIGWLMGLSHAPNVQNVITSVLTLVVGIMSILAGLSVIKKAGESKTDSTSDKTDQSKPNNTEIDLAGAVRTAAASLWPVAGFMGGLIVGSTAGIVTRDNNLLGPNPTLLAWHWGIDRKLITPNDSLVRTISGRTNWVGGSILYEGSMSFCDAQGIELRTGLKNLDNSLAYKSLIEDAADSTLIRIRDEYCSKK